MFLTSMMFSCCLFQILESNKMYLFGKRLLFYLPHISDTICSWERSYVLQVILCFLSFHLLLNWITAVNPFVLFAILYFLLLSIYFKTKPNGLFGLSQILQFVLYSWIAWPGSSAQRALKTGGGNPFIPE